MASKKNESKTNNTMTSQTDKMGDFENFEDFEVSEDFVPATGDVVGYWDPEKSAAMGIPLGVKLFDGNIEPSKPAMLILMKATRSFPVKVKNADQEWEYIRANPGDVVGVWYKPGMRGIVNRGGVEVYVKDSGNTQDTGKPNAMKLFDVKAATIGERIPVLEDTRDLSAQAKTPFTRSGVQRSDADDSDLSFQ